MSSSVLREARTTQRSFASEIQYYTQEAAKLVSGTELCVDFDKLSSFQTELSALSSRCGSWVETVTSLKNSLSTGRESSARQEAESLIGDLSAQGQTMLKLSSFFKKASSGYRGIERQSVQHAPQMPLQPALAVNAKAASGGIGASTVLLLAADSVEEEQTYVEAWLEYFEEILDGKGPEWREMRDLLTKSPEEISAEELKVLTDFLLSLEDTDDLYLFSLCGYVPLVLPGLSEAAGDFDLSFGWMGASEVYQTVLVAAQYQAYAEYLATEPASGNDYSDPHLQTYLSRIMKLQSLQLEAEKALVPSLNLKYGGGYRDNFSLSTTESGRQNAVYPASWQIKNQLGAFFTLRVGNTLSYMGYGEVTRSAMASSAKWNADQGLLETFVQEALKGTLDEALDLMGMPFAVGILLDTAVAYAEVVDNRNARDWEFVASTLDLHVIQNREHNYGLFAKDNLSHTVAPSATTLERVEEVNARIAALRSAYRTGTITIESDTLRSLLSYDDKNPFFELEQTEDGYRVKELADLSLQDVMAYPGLVDEYLELLLNLEIE